MKLLFPLLARSATAWVHNPVVRRSLKSTTRSFKSTTKMMARPTTEESMPLYTLGLNLSKQIGSQFASVVKPGSEMDLVLEGFTDGMRGEISRLDSDEILTKYGPLLNELLQERAGNVVEFQKEEGVKFVDGFLVANPEATKTESGLVYLEVSFGIEMK